MATGRWYSPLDFTNEEEVDLNPYSEYAMDEWRPGDPVNSPSLQKHMCMWRHYVGSYEDNIVEKPKPPPAPVTEKKVYRSRWKRRGVPLKPVFEAPDFLYCGQCAGKMARIEELTKPYDANYSFWYKCRPCRRSPIILFPKDNYRESAAEMHDALTAYLNNNLT